jgi:hypothetical protein
MIYDLDGPYLLTSYKYLCMNPNCGRKNMCSDPRSLAFLGYDRASQYDFFLTSKSGVSRRLLTSLKCAITGGMSFTGQSSYFVYVCVCDFCVLSCGCSFWSYLNLSCFARLCVNAYCNVSRDLRLAAVRACRSPCATCRTS